MSNRLNNKQEAVSKANLDILHFIERRVKEEGFADWDAFNSLPDEDEKKKAIVAKIKDEPEFLRLREARRDERLALDKKQKEKNKMDNGGRPRKNG